MRRLNDSFNIKDFTKYNSLKNFKVIRLGVFIKEIYDNQTTDF